MDIFLVGGAVRDELLNFPITERDWVVLGATPQQMIDLGFEPVGKDFPVFLHPKTKEEYALARTERKTGPGYTGFKVYAAANVTLEEDLARRDLTINAIAKNDAGELIDPFHGRADIRSRTLRHVSPAFAEDPVRILRLARFAARFHHLGFKVAAATNQLMQTMVSAGEVDHLVPERVWKEMSRALSERHPETFIEVLKDCGALARILPEVSALFGVPQRKEFHPEIDTGLHTLMTLQQACQLSDQPTVRFAALVHDLGKATTPADILPRHHGHEESSLPLVRNLCERIGVPNEFKELALHVAKYHTHVHRALTLKASTVVKLLNSLDAFRRPQRFEHFLLSCKADARGRTGFEHTPYQQMNFLLEALTTCEGVTAKPFLEQGIEGKAIGDSMHKQRIYLINQLKKQWDNKP